MRSAAHEKQIIADSNELNARRHPTGPTNTLQRSGDNLMPSSNPRGSRSRGPWGSGPQPDLEEFLRRSQDKLHSALSGNLGGRGIALIALASTALWGFSGFFRVEPDELGVETAPAPSTGLFISQQCQRRK
jgi:Bacterial membrane protein N terminal